MLEPPSLSRHKSFFLPLVPLMKNVLYSSLGQPHLFFKTAQFARYRFVIAVNQGFKCLILYGLVILDIYQVCI